LYPRYREGRAAMPAPLREALPGFHERLRQAGLQVLALPEVEADDVIATGVMRWLQEGRGEAIVATTDKDLHILIAHGALVWDHFKNEWHDDAWVRQRFGVAPVGTAVVEGRQHVGRRMRFQHVAEGRERMAQRDAGLQVGIRFGAGFVHAAHDVQAIDREQLSLFAHGGAGVVAAPP
jgi:hypothetical protein